MLLGCSYKAKKESICYKFGHRMISLNFFQQVWTLGNMSITLFLSFSFLIQCLYFFRTFVCLGYYHNVLALFFQVIIRMMCLHYLFRLLLGCVCKAKKEICQVMLLSIVVLQVLSSCELTMDKMKQHQDQNLNGGCSMLQKEVIQKQKLIGQM